MDILPSCPSVYTGNSVTISSLAGTGINHWWEYEEDQLGGVGRYMVNVATGNMLLQADDMAITHKGIEMALRRTYNAMSKHDAAGSDGSPNLYGDKWTSTFDAHIAYNDFTQINCQRGVTLFDIDGAHYDYAPVGDGHTFNPPAGQFAKLYYDGTNYNWTKKTGTEYVFWDINQSTSNVGYSGQIRYIFARNTNNSLTFQRTWTTDASTLKHLLQMTVTTETTGSVKLVATLNYGDITGSGSTFRVLQNLVWPDNTTTVTYGYTIQPCSCQGNYEPVLTEVDEPGNNVATTLAQQYLYGNGSPLITAVYSPRWVLLPAQFGDGPAFTFGYGTFNNLLQVQYRGDVNPNISDCCSPAGVLQPGITADLGYNSAYRSVNLCYENVGGGGGCNANGGQTVWSDTDGHKTTYLWDTIGRVTQRQDTTGDASPGPATLIYYQGWDSSNDLTFTKDPRSANSSDTTYETDYTYDANGNTTTVAQPSVTTDRGTFRPTSHYTYDSSKNNLLSYCDPVFVHSVNKDYPTSYSCPTIDHPNSNGPNVYVWSLQPPSYEPYGQLLSTTSFTGYQSTFTYDPSSQGNADYGLPTLVKGTQFTEADNQTMITPQESFLYDSYGNLICYNNGNQGFWILQYDSLNRLTGVGDPDDNYLTNSACNKTGTQHTAKLTSYYANGQISQTQAPEQFRYSVATTFLYDANGNETSATHHYDNVAAATKKYYDGADRLIEVWQPLDSRQIPGIPDNTDLYTPDMYASYNSPWITRYHYDLTMGNGQVSVTGASPFNAYGNLFDTVELLPVGFGSLLTPRTIVNGLAPTTPSAPSSLAYYDTKGTAYDALDRPTTKYYYMPGALSQSAGLRSSKLTYDTSGKAGFLDTNKDGVGTTTTYTYDNAGYQATIAFSDTTPGRQYVYDPDGRMASITEQPYGTLYYTYDPNGKIASAKEPTGGGLTSPENPLTYHYYPNGWKSVIDITSTSLTQTGLFSYIYRQDGKRTGIIVQENGKTRNLGWNYTAAGRVASSNDTWRNPNVTYTYGQSYGDVSTYVMQEGGFAGINYDAEGSHIGIGSTPYYSNSPEQFHTNIRGEYYWQVFTGSSNQTRATTADAYLSTTTCWGTACSSAPTISWDGINGVKTQTETDDVNGCVNQIVYGFDSDGRQTSATNHYRVGIHSAICNAVGSYAKAYDAENHLISQTLTNWVCTHGGECASSGDPTMHSGTQSYSWGPNGRPIVISEIFFGYAATLHWDGDSILYTTTNPGAILDDIKIETLADITPVDPSYKDLTVWDRELSGQVVGGHNQTTGPPTSSGVPPDVFIGALGYQAGCYGTNPSCPTLHFYFNRPDGFSDGWNILQGVRSYSTGLESWTTPDPYAGQIHDPMSQKPYMWNRNNPVSYQDPTGFCPPIMWCPPTPRPNANQVRENVAAQASPVVGIGVLITYMSMFSGEGEAESALIGSVVRSVAGKAPEFAAGIVTQSGFLRTAINYLGKAYKDMGGGRFVSADGMRQIRMGGHELDKGGVEHAHFESYDKSYWSGGKVDETSTVQIVPDANTQAPSGDVGAPSERAPL